MPKLDLKILESLNEHATQNKDSLKIDPENKYQQQTLEMHKNPVKRTAMFNGADWLAEQKANYDNEKANKLLQILAMMRK